MSAEVHTEGKLTLEVQEGAEEILCRWRGKSTARKPGNFLNPILADLLERSEQQRKPVVLDFREIDYMNSSTITPLIRALERASQGSSSVLIRYNKGLKWQALSFTALEVFQTDDGRIEIRGV